MKQVSMWLWIIYGRVKRSYIDSIEYSLPQLPAIGLIGVIGFPLYYWVWTDLYPQPYENIWLRLVGTVLSLGLIFVRIWPIKYRPYLGAYWFVSSLYTLSFFFTYMLLMNNGNIVWAMSTMAGLTLLILVAHDWVLVTLMFLLGSLLALMAYGATTGSFSLVDKYWVQLPIYLFLVVAGSVFNYRSTRLKQEKLKALASVGSDICHELRTPLMTMQNNIHGLARYLPELLAAYDLVKEHSLVNNPIQKDKYLALSRAVEQIRSEVEHSNTIIDILLMNLANSKIDTDSFETLWMGEVVDNAIQRYPFESDAEREKVSVHCVRDFQFIGSRILMVHVIFNLLKNALAFTSNTDNARIEIVLDQDMRNNYLYFKDNGQGIPPHERMSIFDNFYTSGVDNNGTGIGLAFCKRVMQYFNASINCNSRLGEYTEFVLCFPEAVRLD